MSASPVLWLIVPCYNEQEVLPITAPLFLDKLKGLITSGKISDSSRILFINDGSSDNTWPIIKSFVSQDKHFSGISLSRNRGHQNALLAGLMEAKDKCTVTISLDCDGQDDINAVDEMLSEYASGSEVVYGVRSNRESDTWLKRSTAYMFYKFIRLMDAEVVYNHADYRLISSRVLMHLSEFKEVNIFLRGIIPLAGFKSSCVMYRRNRRLAGNTKYSLPKLFSLAVEAITSLSVKPITFIASLGIIAGLIGFAGIIWALVSAFIGHSVNGWASTMCVVCFLGGIQLLSLGIIGEYVGKAYMESKHRPRYIVSERV
ncbi:MAG: glycosyltransferase family 2 protein, partial [Synergistaceae bacterium]|nr:glycosyltransferase family 2 protein [Synergistaceae bacterium]